MRGWRNWQTRKIQVLMEAIPCGFKSRSSHQQNTMHAHCVLFCLAKSFGKAKRLLLSPQLSNCHCKQAILRLRSAPIKTGTQVLVFLCEIYIRDLNRHGAVGVHLYTQLRLSPTDKQPKWLFGASS